MEHVPAHQPVLLNEVIDLLAPAGRKVLVDCTVGLGGHAEKLLELSAPDGTLIGIDVDEGNLKLAKERLAKFPGRVRLFQANFSQLSEVLVEAGISQVDGILADLGIASSQLDDPQRGLSFMADGPLDMRLDLRLGSTAADLVNRLEETELADLIYKYGEERYSRRISAAIVNARRRKPVETTAELANIILQSLPAPVRQARKGAHPSTRTFQALRIVTNDEMGHLQRLLEILPSTLALHGRACIIAFHSLEDRPVKHAFAEAAQAGWAKILTKKPLTPSAEEMAINPRSRSAKLRGIERIV